jgi:hypothetical protein
MIRGVGTGPRSLVSHPDSAACRSRHHRLCAQLLSSLVRAYAARASAHPSKQSQRVTDERQWALVALAGCCSKQVDFPPGAYGAYHTLLRRGWERVQVGGPHASTDWPMPYSHTMLLLGRRSSRPVHPLPPPSHPRAPLPSADASGVVRAFVAAVAASVPRETASIKDAQFAATALRELGKREATPGVRGGQAGCWRWHMPHTAQGGHHNA